MTTRTPSPLRAAALGAVIFGGIGFILATAANELDWGAVERGHGALLGSGVGCVLGILALRAARRPDRAWLVARAALAGAAVGAWLSSSFVGGWPVHWGALVGAVAAFGLAFVWAPASQVEAARLEEQEAARRRPAGLGEGEEADLALRLHRQDRADALARTARRRTRYRIAVLFGLPAVGVPLMMVGTAGVVATLVGALVLLRVDDALTVRVEEARASWLRTFGAHPETSGQGPPPARSDPPPLSRSAAMMAGCVALGLPAFLWGLGSGAVPMDTTAGGVYAMVGVSVGALLGAAYWEARARR